MRRIAATTLLTLLLLLFAPNAHADTHFWVGGLIGSWTDAANWSTSGSTGPGGAGAPAPGDDARLFNFSTADTRIVIFDAAYLAELDDVQMTGTAGGAQGTLTFSMNAGSVLRTNTLTAGITGETDLQQNSATLYVDDDAELGPGSSASANTWSLESGALLDIAGDFNVGTNGGQGDVDQSGGDALIAHTLRIAEGIGADATWTTTDGTLDADVIDVGTKPSSGGASPVGLLDIGGGAVTAREVNVGRFGRGTILMSGGALDVTETLRINAEEADGELAAQGGTINAATIRVETEFFVTGIEGALMENDGADITADELIINFENASFRQGSGTTTINGPVRLGDAPFLDADLARITINGGLFQADELRGSGDLIVNGGRVDLGDMPQTFYGDIVLNDGDFRTDDLESYGQFTMSNGVFSGGYAPPPIDAYTLGAFTLRKGLWYRGGRFVADLIAEADIFTDAPMTIEGDLVVNSFVNIDDQHRVTVLGDVCDINAVLDLDGGDLSAPDAIIKVSEDALLRGPGLVVGDVEVAYALSPGDVLRVVGDCTLGPDSETRFWLDENPTASGWLIDRLEVPGAVTLDGLCRVFVPIGFDPDVGDRWTIVESDAINGRFDCVETNPAEGGADFPGAFDLAYTPTRVELVYRGECAADATGDGLVSFDDLNLLLDQWGTTGDDLDADFDCSGDVGFADLNLLLDAWGERCP